MMKVIFLVDMNAFYISCEITRYPKLLGKPAAVAGDPKRRSGIILSANYEARELGVKTAMVLKDALELCPNMQLIPPDHSFYEKKSHEVMQILSSYTPILEQNSIDEAWLDMSGSEKLFGAPIKAAKHIMENIKDELGLWCSIGISENKFLSKMASELKKPLGITELWKDDIQSKLWPLPVGRMYGVGKQTARKLQNMGINTIGDLALCSQNTLIKKFGKSGIEMHAHANGIDDSIIKPRDESDMKSIGRSTTLSEDVSDFEKAKIVLMQLADEVAMTARKFDKKGRTIQITLKYANFKTITRQKTIIATNLTKEICYVGIDLLKDNWNDRKPIRLIGISLSGFEENIDLDQISIMDLMMSLPSKDCNYKINMADGSDKSNSSSGSSKIDKEERLEEAICSIREKYGFSKITRAIQIYKENN